MRHVFGEPSRHPTGWLSLAAGLVALAFVILIGDLSGLGLSTFLVGLAFTTLGLAEVLPIQVRAVTALLRIVGLLLAAATIIVSLYGIIFQVP
jgi:hypothetical protein